MSLWVWLRETKASSIWLCVGWEKNPAKSCTYMRLKSFKNYKWISIRKPAVTLNRNMCEQDTPFVYDHQRGMIAYLHRIFLDADGCAGVTHDCRLRSAVVPAKRSSWLFCPLGFLQKWVFRRDDLRDRSHRRTWIGGYHVNWPVLMTHLSCIWKDGVVIVHD